MGYHSHIPAESPSVLGLRFCALVKALTGVQGFLQPVSPVAGEANLEHGVGVQQARPDAAKTVALAAAIAAAVAAVQQPIVQALRSTAQP